MHPSRWMLLGFLALSLLMMGGIAPAAGDDPYEKWKEYVEPPSAQQLKFVRWSDPQENSFGLEVPANWTVQGGVAWNGINVARQWVKVRNPSNTAIVFIGDPDMLPRLVPNQVYERAGYTSGSAITTEAGTKTLLQPYMAGEQYALFHARTICSNPRNAGSFRLQRDSADFMRAMQPFQAYMKVLVTVGEALVNCGSFNGYVRAVTLLAGQNGPGVDSWDIFALGGFAATGSADYELSRQVLLRMEATYRVNPQWRAGVDDRLHIANTIFAQANEAMESMMLETGRRYLNAHTRIANQWSNIILGQEHRCTASGECRETTNACDYVWKNVGGQAVPGVENAGPDGWFCGPSDGGPPPQEYGPWVPTEITQP
jgi:hypothetical protein